MTFAMIIAGLLTVIASLGVVCAKKTLNCALCLVVTLFLVAVNFALLNAHFLAALQIMVYAGAIMVLVVFVVMLLGLDEISLAAKGKDVKGVSNRIIATSAVSLFLIFSVWVFTSGDLSVTTGFGTTGIGSGGIWNIAHKVASGSQNVVTQTFPKDTAGAAAIGELLLTKYLFAFEITSLLLLAAMIGAVVLAYDKPTALPAGRGLKAKRTALNEAATGDAGAGGTTVVGSSSGVSRSSISGQREGVTA